MFAPCGRTAPRGIYHAASRSSWRKTSVSFYDANMNYTLFALGLAYLLIFGVGSIGGMMLMSAIISLPFVFTASRFTRVGAPVRLLAGLLSVAFGIYYAWETAGGL